MVLTCVCFNVKMLELEVSFARTIQAGTAVSSILLLLLLWILSSVSGLLVSDPAFTHRDVAKHGEAAADMLLNSVATQGSPSLWMLCVNPSTATFAQH